MAATALAAVSPFKQVVFGKYEQAVFEVIICTFF